MADFYLTFMCILTALEWKNIEYEYKPVHLIKDGGQQVTQISIYHFNFNIQFHVFIEFR